MRVTSIRNPRPFPLSLAFRCVPVLLLAAAALGQTTAAWALTCTSVASSNWSVAGTWTSAGNCNRVPLAGDDVVIDTGTTLDTSSAALASLTVNGTLTVGNSATARALTVTGDIVVGGAGAIAVGATAATHTLAAGGNVANAGTVNFRPAANRVVNVTFNRNGSQTVSGAGAYTFNLITVNQGTSNANVLDMQAAITVPSPFLTITNGTYKHSSPTNIAPWTTAGGATIPATGGFWLDSGAAVTTTGVNVTINGGYLRISGGTMTIGAANTTRLILGDFASTLFRMDDGTLTVTGGINSASNTAAGTFTVAGGTVYRRVERQCDDRRRRHPLGHAERDGRDAANGQRSVERQPDLDDQRRGRAADGLEPRAQSVERQQHPDAIVDQRPKRSHDQHAQHAGPERGAVDQRRRR
jgi:hypothetical protein